MKPTPKLRLGLLLVQELRFYMKHSTVAIHQLKSSLAGHDEVLLQDVQGCNDVVMKIREIKLKIIWAEKPNMKESLTLKP